MPVEPIDGDALVGTGDGAGGIRGVEDFEGGTTNRAEKESTAPNSSQMLAPEEGAELVQ